MPEDAAWRTWPLITRLVKTWFEINGLWSLAAIMAIINSCLLCCCGPSAPIVLKAEANTSVVYWAFIPALQPIRATAARLRGPVEHGLWFCPDLTPLLLPPLPLKTLDPLRPLGAVQAGHICGRLCQV